MAKLILKLKDTVHGKIPIDKPQITIGRDRGNDIVIENLVCLAIMPKFFTIRIKFFIEDSKSGNGVFVNKQKSPKRCSAITMKSWWGNTRWSSER